jgi:rhodanese-related sulfurtransferase
MSQLSQFIINHWELCLALIMVLLFILINELYAQKKQAKALSTAEAIALINHEDAVIVDIREPDAFRAGHVIHSIRVAADEFNQKRMDKYKAKPLILVCTRGVQSATLASQLRAQGFMQAMSLSGGITAWQEANLPLVKGKS